MRNMVDINKGTFYLVVRKGRWNMLKARISNKAPALEVGEVAITLNVKVPATLFTKPQIQATVSIPENAVTPPVLNAEVLDNVREVLEQRTGMDISVRLVEAVK